jgi:predicted amidohydrolase YtcJ
MILANATIYTADPARPFAAAMAVRAGRVLRVGTYESVSELKGRHTHELNLSGNVVLPGFVDSHVHFIDGGLQVCLPHLTLHMGSCQLPICSATLHWIRLIVSQSVLCYGVLAF